VGIAEPEAAARGRFSGDDGANEFAAVQVILLHLKIISFFHGEKPRYGSGPAPSLILLMLRICGCFHSYYVKYKTTERARAIRK
jgi:hypothetical protein